jgi:hypothetical protein
MKETLKLLQDYASTTDNVWMQKQLEVLELEIDCEIIKGKMSVQDAALKLIDTI